MGKFEQYKQMSKILSQNMQQIYKLIPENPDVEFLKKN